MTNKIIKIQKATNELYVYWVLTDFCNQQCSYCHPELHRGEHWSGQRPGYPTDAEILNLADELNRISVSQTRPLKINISGGEPTTHPVFPQLLEKFRGAGHTVEVTTNGSYNVKYWKNLMFLPSMVIISLHPQYYDSKKIRINDLLDFLSQSNVKIMMNLMCLPDKWQTVQDIVSDVAEPYKKFIVPKVIWDVTSNRATLQYNKDQLDFITSYQSSIDLDHTYHSTIHYADGSTERLIPNKFVSHGRHYHYGWKCSAGMDSISIHPDGTVRAGICRAKIISTVQNFKLSSDYITCPLKACTCPGDLLINKYDPSFTSEPT